ncbi:hypothetical protein HMPREF0262_00946 [Clostridium sp. ATCC 29733]|nr:hypothetical protein HMPREF0262_00946 [Clostridium sp. ATCC 29733]
MAASSLAADWRKIGGVPHPCPAGYSTTAIDHCIIQCNGLLFIIFYTCFYSNIQGNHLGGELC